MSVDFVGIEFVVGASEDGVVDGLHLLFFVSVEKSLLQPVLGDEFEVFLKESK